MVVWEHSGSAVVADDIVVAEMDAVAVVVPDIHSQHRFADVIYG